MQDQMSIVGVMILGRNYDGPAVGAIPNKSHHYQTECGTLQYHLGKEDYCH